MSGFFMRLPRNRREAVRWRLRNYVRWHYWRQTRLIQPIWIWWMLRQTAPDWLRCSICDAEYDADYGSCPACGSNDPRSENSHSQP